MYRELSRKPSRELLVRFAHRALELANSERAVRRALEAWPEAPRPPFVLALGKASVAMAKGAHARFPDAEGLVVSPETDAARAWARASPWPILYGDHPVPTERSLAAGREVLRLAEALAVGQPVLCLLSGGASSLVECLVPATSLGDLRMRTAELLGSGLPIEAVNEERAKLSRIKGGGLRAILGDREVRTLVVSDVPSDDLATIGGGPMYSTRWPSPHEILLSGRLVAEALAAEVRADGLSALVQGPMRGLAHEVGARLAADPLPSSCTIAYGETTVALEGRPVGNGGRNQHLALAFASALPIASERALLAFGTDGIDGVSTNAGAYVDADTVQRAQAKGLSAREYLARFDSATFFDRAGDAFTTGPTGTNVSDLVLVLGT